MLWYIVYLQTNKKNGFGIPAYQANFPTPALAGKIYFLTKWWRISVESNSTFQPQSTFQPLHVFVLMATPANYSKGYNLRAGNPRLRQPTTSTPAQFDKFYRTPPRLPSAPQRTPDPVDALLSTTPSQQGNTSIIDTPLHPRQLTTTTGDRTPPQVSATTSTSATPNQTSIFTSIFTSAISTPAITSAQLSPAASSTPSTTLPSTSQCHPSIWTTTPPTTSSTHPSITTNEEIINRPSTSQPAQPAINHSTITTSSTHTAVDQHTATTGSAFSTPSTLSTPHLGTTNQGTAPNIQRPIFTFPSIATTTTLRAPDTVHPGNSTYTCAGSNTVQTKLPETFSCDTDFANTCVTLNSAPAQKHRAVDSFMSTELQKPRGMSVTLKLDKFSGIDNENAHVWLRQYLQYCTIYNILDDQKHNILPFHLTTHAKIWYNSLPDDVRSNWEVLKEAFLKRFSAENTQNDLSILQISQSETESVNDYLSKIQKSAAFNDKLNTELLVAIAVNGLKTEIRKIVLNKEPKSIEQVRHAATLAEKSLNLPSITSINTLKDTMVNEIQTLRQEIQEIHAITSNTEQTNPSTYIPPSGTQRDNYHTRPNAPYRTYNNSQYHQPYRQINTPTQPTYRPRGQYIQPQYGNDRQPQYNPRNNQPHLRHTHPPVQPPSQHKYSPPPTNYSSNNYLCIGCGNISCKSRKTCKARLSHCTFCGKIGHYSRMCMSSKKQTQ